MDILAFGVQQDERPLLERAFQQRQLHARCVDVFMNHDTAPLAAGHEVISVSVNADLDADTLRALAKGGTRMIAQRATGFNNIALDTAAELGMTVARVSYYSPFAVAEFAWALAMAVNRRVVRAARRTREFDFRLDGLMGRDMHGRTVGVIGTGKIGEAFTRIAHGFGMNLLGWDVAENPACVELGMRYVELPRLLADADLLSLHVPLLSDTHHLIDGPALRSMKDDALLINSSRGGLVDTEALVEELRQGRFSGVGLDVYEAESGLFFLDRSLDVVQDDVLARLMTFSNVLVTSHQAYYTTDAVGQIVDTTVSNVEDYLAGRTSANVLTAPGQPPAAQR
ncbi:NAD(P)-dependent oxidoreductase [Streptomyces sp. NPDC048172]|uniref:NAD(P)-dependent oxidoreductase n=1 Tax=Streptomyces sp. NPDC048172 TaxID=3365505 RepID=UPI00371DA871